jgi:O-6-methylguanine DNA methyltransferase
MKEKRARRRFSLFEQVYEFTRQVPRGRVTTYAAIALALGRPRSARVVGFVMSICPYPERIVPCHRVVRSDGSVGGYGFEGSERKASLLLKEGIEISKGGRIDLSKYLFVEFRKPIRSRRMTLSNLT